MFKKATGKFNDISNSMLAVIILGSIIVIVYAINSYFTPNLNVTNTNVMNLINNWNVRVTAMSCLIITFLVRHALNNIWDCYNKKCQGNVYQNKKRG